MLKILRHFLKVAPGLSERVISPAIFLARSSFVGEGMDISIG